MTETKQEFVLRLRSIPQPDNVEKRLAAAMKSLLRRHGFRCIAMERAEGESEPTTNTIRKDQEI